MAAALQADLPCRRHRRGHEVAAGAGGHGSARRWDNTKFSTALPRLVGGGGSGGGARGCAAQAVRLEMPTFGFRTLG